jgi:hypothetical protein
MRGFPVLLAVPPASAFPVRVYGNPQLRQRRDPFIRRSLIIGPHSQHIAGGLLKAF